MTTLPNHPLWDDAPWTTLPALAGAVSTDVCVVGLGGSGLACIDELRARNVDVIGIDATDVGAGAAGRNGGFILAGIADFHHDAVATLGRARAATLYRATLDEIDRMLVDTPDAIARTGSLRLAGDSAERADCVAQLTALRADGFPGEWYAGPEGEGLLISSDGSMQPLARVRAMATRVLASGAQLFIDTAAIGFSSGVVHTTRGDIRCGATIVAVDGALERVLPDVAGRVRTARLQMLATAPARDVTIPRPIYARYGFDYWQQRTDGVVALGGGRDHFEQEEWVDSDLPTAPVQRYLDEVLRDVIGTRAPVTHRWAARVAYTPSGAPLIDEVRPGLWAIGGYCGTGNVVGALCGRAVARAVTGDQTLLAMLR
jgi:gamma-glutamylputrescine oxidase